MILAQSAGINDPQSSSHMQGTQGVLSGAGYCPRSVAGDGRSRNRTTAESRTLLPTKSVAPVRRSMASTLVRYKIMPFLAHKLLVK